MTTEPNTITFHNNNTDWVMRITADKRIEVNKDVEVTEAAQKVLDAMQYLLKTQRPWVGLSDKDITETFDEVPSAQSDPWWLRYAKAIEAKLRSKNT